MGGWIRCSEKSPRQGQEVQVSDGHDVGVWRWRGFWPDNNWYRCSGSNHAQETLRPVTHWKPLSEPPKDADNVSSDFDWFDSLVSTSYIIYPINDGTHDKYQQDTPKKRCIAYMEALLSGEELTTIPGMEKCYAEFKASNPQSF